MNTKFPVLSAVARLLGVTGWVVVILGLLLAVYGGVIQPHQRGYSFDALDLGAGLAGALGGLLAVAVSEIIGVLFAIEENTRANRL